MKKLLALILTVSMTAMMMTGCVSKKPEANAPEKPKEEQTATPNDKQMTIGIVQIVEHPSLDTIRESFIAGLADQGFKDGENLKIDYQNAQGDQSNLNSICKKFVGDKVDLIVAIATPSAQAAAAATSDIPVLFSAVTDPVAAKLVSDPAHPNTNVTGTSDAIPVDQVFALCKELTPNAKKIGFLYTASEVNSKAVVDKAIALTSQYGFEYQEVTITNTSELKQAATSLAGKVDAIYTPIDNSIASAMPTLAQVGIDNKIPVYVGADSMVIDGGYATVGINYTNLGVKTAEMAAKILNGTPVSELPVCTLDNFQKVINKKTANAIGAPAEYDGALIVE
ncbi:MAG: ABC transporter substrate-binding protein [Oscillospiraceae bacterium]